MTIFMYPPIVLIKTFLLYIIGNSHSMYSNLLLSIDFISYDKGIDYYLLSMFLFFIDIKKKCIDYLNNFIYLLYT